MAVRDRDDRLGLTLMAIPTDQVDAAVQTLRAERPQRAGEEGSAATAGSAHGSAGDDRPALDRLLDELRECCRARFGGWTPTLGKNRVVRGMHFLPYPDAAGGVPPSAPQTPQDGAPRQFFDTGKRLNGEQVRVGVLDTELSPQPGLDGRYLARPGSLLRQQGGIRQWWAGHATFVAGRIAHQAPAAELHVRSVLDNTRGEASLWETARRLVRFAGTVDVLNLSFGCYTDDGQPPLALQRAISQLTPTVVVVAAAGNYGDASHPGWKQDEPPPPPDTPVWPAAFPDVLAVGAMDGNQPASFNPHLTAGAPDQPGDEGFRRLAPWIDVLADGVNVLSTYLDGEVDLGEPGAPPTKFSGWATWSGTSFAAATVTGVIASRTLPRRRPAYAALDELLTGGAPTGWRVRKR